MIRLAFVAMVGVLAACNSLLGIEDLSGPADGDASIDAPDAPPGITRLRGPRLGAATGSAHAESSLRPRLAWYPTPDATRYELAVDDSCQTSSFRTCVLPSPEIMEVALTNTEYVPGAGLTVSLSAPVGRRYFWRVRSCNEIGCGEWSDVWYVDVGRLADDVNGDGYGDLLIGVDSRAGGALEIGEAFVAFGRPGNGAITITRIDDPRATVDGRFGRTVAMVGDVNADGYGDALVGAWRTQNNGHLGTAFLYLGRGTWPANVTEATTAIAIASADASAAFGGALAGGGDVNGDGYADMAIGAMNILFDSGDGAPTVPGYAYVNFGRPSWSFAQLGSDLVIPDPTGTSMNYFASSLALGDLDEDGHSDLIVGAPVAAENSGIAGVYFGDATYPAAPHTIGAADVTLPAPATGLVFHGASAAVCGPSQDGPALAIGAPAESRPATAAGVTRVYGPRAPWPATVSEPELTLPHPSGAINGSMGMSIRCADVNADGRDDMIVGAPTGDDAGEVYIFDAVLSFPENPMTTLTSGNAAFGTLGTSVAITDFDGDGVADVFAGAPKLGVANLSGRVLGWLGRSVWPSALMAADITIDNPDGLAGERFGLALD